MVRSSLASTAPEAAGALESLTALHERFRYSRDIATDADVKDARDLAAALRSALSRLPAKARPTPATAEAGAH